MRRTLDVHPLDLNQIASLLKIIPSRTFNMGETLVYEKQIPTAGYVLLQGKIVFEKKGSLIKEVPLNSLICLRELLEDLPTRHCVKIEPGSIAIIIDKSTALELNKQKGQFSLPA